jgi:hypothetical protein
VVDVEVVLTEVVDVDPVVVDELDVVFDEDFPHPTPTRTTMRVGTMRSRRGVIMC